VTLERALRPAIAALALVGAGVTAYLTATHYAHTAPLCVGSGCELVQRSDWATLAGVPVATLGLLAFLAILASAALRARLAGLAGYGVALAGAIFAVYLIAVQAAVLNAICPWCVAGDTLAVVLVGLTAARALLRSRE
jgi:uncharacterized membrane protein